MQNVKIITSKLLRDVKTIVKCQNYYKMSKLSQNVKMLWNIKIITKSKLLQMLKLLRNIRNVKIIMKTNINLLNSNISKMTKLQFIKLYISYFYLNVTSLLMQTIYYPLLF